MCPSDLAARALLRQWNRAFGARLMLVSEVVFFATGDLALLTALQLAAPGATPRGVHASLLGQFLATHCDRPFDGLLLERGVRGWRVRPSVEAGE